MRRDLQIDAAEMAQESARTASKRAVGRRFLGKGGVVRIDGSAKEVIELGRNRLVVAAVLFTVCFAVLGGRMIMLATYGAGEGLKETAAHSAASDDPHQYSRADIVDRNGVILATNVRAPSLYADTREILDAEEAARKLTAVLPGLSLATIESRLSSGRSFIWIKRNLTPNQQYAVNRLGIPGLHFRDEERRVYPQASLLAHVLGHTDVDGQGIAGVEKAFNDRLKAPAALSGGASGPLRLSVDVRVQHALRDELLRSVSFFQAKGGSGVVLDVRTGEVLAMVSLPDFDPNDPSAAPKAARFNRATLGVYEMGSTFKTFTLAMALETGTAGLSGGYDASKPIYIGGFRIRDYHAENRWLSLPEIYMYSSNIGAAKMAEDVGNDRQKQFLSKLGMLSRPSIELPEVGAPLVPARWNTIETMTIGFGHGISVSPLQLTDGIAAVVNGGVLPPTTIIRRDPDEVVVGERVLSPQTSRAMRRLMRLVVDQGTGKKADAPGYLVGGKTGTAEKPGAGGYNHSALLSSFIAAFPMTSPRYAVFAMLDEPQGNESTHGFATAGWTAAPVAGRVIARIAPLLGVEPIDEEAEDIRQAMFVKLPGEEKKLASF